jgi:hypothetical protein
VSGRAELAFPRRAEESPPVMMEVREHRMQAPDESIGFGPRKCCAIVIKEFSLEPE